MKYFRSIAILSMFSLMTSVFGQHSEIGLFGGTSYYLGELNPGIQVLNKLNPSLGVFYRKNLNKRYSLRFGANYGQLEASDEFGSAALAGYRRLAFNSTVLEGYGILEFNFIPYQINDYSTSNFTPYTFIGVAFFGVDPSLEGFGASRTTSQGGETAPSVPFGFGIKFNFIKNLGLGIEWGMRKTFTDQLDGLQDVYIGGYQLSNTQNNDWYSFLGITLNYKFLTKTDRCPGVIN